MTKNQLLQKGISPDVADEILRSFNADAGDSPLLALNKALKGSKEAENELFKAEDSHEEPDGDEGKGKGSEESDEDGDEEAYMKKAEKEKAEKMSKARAELDLDNAAGGVVEMADLSAFLNATSEFSKVMCKAVGDLRSEIRTLKAQNAETYSLMAKAAAVQAVTAEAFGQSLGQSAGRKGVTTIPATDMAKAAAVSDSTKVYQTLAKAMNAGDRQAGFILSAFESTGKRVDRLDATSKKYISELLSKGE